MSIRNLPIDIYEKKKYNMIIYLSSLVGISMDYFEAARIDGAKELTIFKDIVMPLVKPAWLTMLMTSVQSMWAITGSTVIFSESLKPLQYALSQVTAAGVARTGASAAITVIMILPPLLVFVLSQTQILDTMASSGIKE